MCHFLPACPGERTSSRLQRPLCIGEGILAHEYFAFYVATKARRRNALRDTGRTEEDCIVQCHWNAPGVMVRGRGWGWMCLCLCLCFDFVFVCVKFVCLNMFVNV